MQRQQTPAKAGILPIIPPRSSVFGLLPVVRRYLRISRSNRRMARRRLRKDRRRPRLIRGPLRTVRWLLRMSWRPLRTTRWLLRMTRRHPRISHSGPEAVFWPARPTRGPVRPTSAPAAWQRRRLSAERRRSDPRPDNYGVGRGRRVEDPTYRAYLLGRRGKRRRDEKPDALLLNDVYGVELAHLQKVP